MDAVLLVNSSVADQSMSDGAQLQNDQQVYQDYQDQDRCYVEDHLEIPNSTQPMNKHL